MQGQTGDASLWLLLPDNESGSFAVSPLLLIALSDLHLKKATVDHKKKKKKQLANWQEQELGPKLRTRKEQMGEKYRETGVEEAETRHSWAQVPF